MVHSSPSPKIHYISSIHIGHHLFIIHHITLDNIIFFCIHYISRQHINVFIGLPRIITVFTKLLAFFHFLQYLKFSSHPIFPFFTIFEISSHPEKLLISSTTILISSKLGDLYPLVEY